MKALVWSWLVVGVSLAYGGVGRGADASACTGDRRAAGRPVRLGGRLRDLRGCTGGGVGRVRRGVFGGADVRPVPGVCGRPGREQHGGGLGGIVRFGRQRAAGSVIGGLLARRVGVHGPGLGLRPVVEEELGLNEAARRQIQQGLRSAGFDPGGADGLFGPRTRAAIRSWQSAHGGRSTGYLNGLQVEALRGRGESWPPASAGAAAADSGGLEVVFWQSIQNSTSPVEWLSAGQTGPSKNGGPGMASGSDNRAFGQFDRKDRRPMRSVGKMSAMRAVTQNRLGVM